MACWWIIAVFLTLLGCNGVRCVLVPGSRLPQMQRKLQTATGLAEMRGEQHRVISATRYTNDWAVQVEGGAQAADTLATATGFINMGQVRIKSDRGHSYDTSYQHYELVRYSSLLIMQILY